MSTATGEWRAYVYTNGVQEVTYYAGTTTNDGSERTSGWNAGVEATVKAGFNFGGISGEVSVTGSYSRSMSISVAQSVQESISNTLTTKFDKPGGQVWQFVYTAKDTCGVVDIKTRDLVMTENRARSPCCLPGFAVSSTMQHGPCEAGSPCMCSTNICNAPPESQPTEFPNEVFTTPTQSAARPPTPTNSGASLLQSVCGVSGHTQACICLTGSGVQSCTEAGSWSPCICAAKASRAICLHPRWAAALLVAVLVALSAAFR